MSGTSAVFNLKSYLLEVQRTVSKKCQLPFPPRLLNKGVLCVSKDIKLAYPSGISDFKIFSFVQNIGR